LTEDGIDFVDIKEETEEGEAYLAAVADASISALGYFLKPSELFSAVAKRGSIKGQFIIEDLGRILSNIERSTMGTESEDDFDDLFSDMDLTSNKLGRTEAAKNELIAKVLTHLDEIDFELEKVDSDVLGDAYEYLIGKHPNDILFVDASTCFEKAKNQNVLLPEHIDRTVAAYRSRAEEPRFAVKAKLSAVAENDYNLNIPRYVDTFEAEEPIDLAAVAAELKANAAGMADLDAQIAGFCAELGIEAPL
jgi:type I restriction-modification system DNA methylase subunit